LARLDGFSSGQAVVAFVARFLLGGRNSFCTGYLFKTRSLTFLQSLTIRSAGRIVSTEELAGLFARRFVITGMVLLAVSLMLIAIQLWRSRKLTMQHRDGGQESESGIKS
jgi:hypothetical protein